MEGIADNEQTLDQQIRTLIERSCDERKIPEELRQQYYDEYAAPIRQIYHEIHTKIINKYTPELQHKYEGAISILLPSICESILDYGLDHAQEFMHEFKTRLAKSELPDTHPILFPYNSDNKVEEDSTTHMTPLMIAVDNHWLHLIRNLKDVMNEKTDYGKTALYYAIEEKNYGIVPLLIELGADVNIGTNVDMTPLIRACRNGDVGMVQFLIDRGAAVVKTSWMYNQMTIHDKSALMWAAEGGHTDIVKLLLSKMTHGQIRHDVDIMEDVDHYWHGLIHPEKRVVSQVEVKKKFEIRENITHMLADVIEPFLEKNPPIIDIVQQEDVIEEEEPAMMDPATICWWVVVMFL